MNLRLRINMGFLLIVFLMATVAGVIIYQQAKMQTAFQDSLQTCELDRYLLECRRQEKNYICCDTDQQAIDLFQTNYDTLYTMTIKLSDDISDNHIIDKLSDLQESLVNYYSVFMQTVQYRDNTDYKRQFDISSRACVKSARECHSIIEKIRHFSEERFNTALSISCIVNTFSIIFGIFLAVVISSFIADKIMDIIANPDNPKFKIAAKGKK